METETADKIYNKKNTSSTTDLNRISEGFNR